MASVGLRPALFRTSHLSNNTDRYGAQMKQGAATRTTGGFAGQPGAQVSFFTTRFLSWWLHRLVQMTERHSGAPLARAMRAGPEGAQGAGPGQMQGRAGQALG